MLRASDDWLVRKRDGRVVPFEESRIRCAMVSAFRAELNLTEDQPLDADVSGEISQVVHSVLDDAAPLACQAAGVDVERIQDLVEMALMSRGHFRVARRYIIYRSE